MELTQPGRGMGIVAGPYSPSKGRSLDSVECPVGQGRHNRVLVGLAPWQAIRQVTSPHWVGPSVTRVSESECVCAATTPVPSFYIWLQVLDPACSSCPSTLHSIPTTTHHGQRLARRGRRLSARAMVSLDACVYVLVVDGGAECECAGAIQHHLTLLAILHCTHCLLQEPGQSIAVPTHRRLYSCPIVLETTHNLLLLQPFQSQPTIPHLLPPAIHATTRGIVWPLDGTLPIAPHLCFHNLPLHCIHHLHGLPRLRFVQHAHLHLEQKEPRHNA